MRLSSDDVLGLFISLRTGVADVAALRSKLEAIIVGGVSVIAKGKVLIGTASGGTQVSYSLPSLGSFTAEDVQDGYLLIYRLLKRLIAETPSLILADLIVAVEAALEQPVYSCRLTHATSDIR